MVTSHFVYVCLEISCKAQDIYLHFKIHHNENQFW